ncbi:hypothetical protein HPB47_017151 [Ixodes persulcatus]|uniref:Uncharacterized protein n=1 Tax=Ixodes persulcatus TaxID=34615 RepID=A0AC60QP26_IXOPE|nr:hypothetical protein HPB47_017151 [Ixodes persulcatus]
MDQRRWYLLVGAAWTILTLGSSTALSDADNPCGIALERSRRAEVTPEDSLQSCIEQNGFKDVKCVVRSGSIAYDGVLCRRQLVWLPKKRSTRKKQRGVTFLGGASLPDELWATLDRGPKFAFEPQLPPPEKLSLVRGFTERALPQDRERCIADGVDALCRTAGHRPKSLKMGAIADHFKCANLKLQASDKEGGFVVLPYEL